MNFEGDVIEIDLLEKLEQLGRERFTGALRFENGDIIKIIYLKSGDILSASTNDRADSLDEILLRSGKITRDHVRESLARRKESETLGDALLSLGFITRKELFWARRIQLLGIIRSLMGWRLGTYTIVADYLPKREEGTSFHLPQIVLEVLVTEDNREKVEQRLASGAAVPRRTARFEEQYPLLSLNQEADAIVQAIDGSSSADQIAATVSTDEFSVYKLIDALARLGLLELSTPASIPKAEPEVSVPTFEMGGDEFDFNDPSSGPENSLDPAEPESEEVSSTPEIEFEAAGAGAPDSFGEEAEPAAEAFGEPDDASFALDVPAERDVAERTSEPSGAGKGEWKGSWTPPSSAAGGDGDDLVIPEEGEEAAPALIPPDPPVPSRTTPSASPAVTTPRNRRSRAPLFIGGLLLLLLLATAGWWFFLRSAPQTPAPVTPARIDVVETGPSPATAVEAESVAEEESPGEATETAQASTGAAPEPVAADAPAEPVRPPAEVPAPVAASNSPAGSERERYDAMAARYLAEAGSVAFTVQFELVCQTASITRALNEGGSSVWFVPIRYQNRDCYRVFWGRHATRAEAERSVESIPASLRGSRPVVIEPRKLAE